MTEKVKKKIEAMADDYFLNCGGDSPNIDTACAAQNLSDGYVKGATPWAEWCERFETALDQLMIGFEHNTDMDDETYQWFFETTQVLGEYRSWLEEQ